MMSHDSSFIRAFCTDVGLLKYCFGNKHKRKDRDVLSERTEVVIH